MQIHLFEIQKESFHVCYQMQVDSVLESTVFPLPFKDLRWNFIFYPRRNAIMKNRGALEQIM